MMWSPNSVHPECDDGNTDSGDGCSATCQVEAGWACSNPGRPCTAICGDGLVRGTEQCDDHDRINGDGCDNTCSSTGCGNGIKTRGEQCDDGSALPRPQDQDSLGGAGDGR